MFVTLKYSMFRNIYIEPPILGVKRSNYAQNNKKYGGR